MKRAITGIAAAGLALGMMVPAAFATTTSTVQWKSVNITAGSYTAAPKGFTADDYGSTTPTTFAPVYYVQQAMKALGYTVKWDGTNLWVTTPANATPDLSNISVGTGNAGIYVNGTLVKKVYTQVMKDPLGGAHAVNTTYVPIFYIDALLKAAGESATWDGSGWAMTAPSAVATALTAKQTAASTVEVDFNGPVASGTAVTLSDNGVNYNTTATWSSDMKTATLATGYNLPAGAYTVTAGSLTGTVTLTAAVPTAITVSTSALASVSDATVNFSEVDQFGSMLSAGQEGNLSFYAVDTTNGAPITISRGVGDTATLDLQNVSKGDNIAVTITDSTNGLSKSVTIPVVGISNIATLTLGAASDNGSSNVNVGDTGMLAYTGVDVSGNAVKLPTNATNGNGVTVNGNTAVIDGIEFLSSNNNVVDASSFTTDSDGNLQFTAAGAGTATITAVDLGTGTSSTTAITVANGSSVASFKLSAPTSLMTADSTTAIPYTAADAFGNAISQASFDGSYQSEANSSGSGPLLTISSSNPSVLPSDFNGSSASSAENSANHIYFDSATNALEVTPTGTGSTTLYVYVNGVLQNSVTLNVQAQAYPAALTATNLSTYFENVVSATETLDASNLKLVDQYNNSYSPSTSDAIYVQKVSGGSDFGISLTTPGTALSAATQAAVATATASNTNTVYSAAGDAQFTITPVAGATGSETFTVGVYSPVSGKTVSYNVTLNAVSSSSISSYALSAPTTVYDTSHAVFPNDSTGTALTASAYDQTVSLTGKTAGGQSVVLGSTDSAPAYVTTSDSSVVNVTGTDTIEGVGSGSATITAYNASGSVVGTAKVTTSDVSPVLTTLTAENTSSPSVSAATAGQPITTAVIGSTATGSVSGAGLEAFDQYGVQIQLPTGFWISSNSSIIKGGTTLTAEADGTANVTYVSPNGVQTQLSVTVSGI